MINIKDFYTYSVTVPIANQDNGRIGTSIIDYEIRRYRDVRNMTDTLAYQVHCKQRIVIPNTTPYQPGANIDQQFLNYSAIVRNEIDVTQEDGITIEILKYLPKTINSAVSTSLSNNSSAENSTSYQHTVGSSTSQTNTAGGSASLGFMGDIPTGGLSFDGSTSSTTTHEQSTTKGRGTSNSTGASESDSMTIKDWACYASLDTEYINPTWVWGQEHPWDVIKYNTGKKDSFIRLPQFVENLLYDATNELVLPPSQLSLFGIDFTMQSLWLVKLDRPEDFKNFVANHTIQCWNASHSYDSTSNSVSAKLLDPFLYEIPSIHIDLYTYGLDPIGEASTPGGVTGFTPSKFIINPVPASSIGSQPVPFKIISESNNLMIDDTTTYLPMTASDEGAGFAPSETSLNVVFTESCTNLQMTLSFKISDTVNDYTLYMKHWKTNEIGIILTFIINGNLDNPIVKLVDSLEAEGGENNLLTISLRNTNYGTIDYHDYLQMGLNTIEVNIKPMKISANLKQDCGYQIRAIALGKQ